MTRSALVSEYHGTAMTPGKSRQSNDLSPNRDADILKVSPDTTGNISHHSVTGVVLTHGYKKNLFLAKTGQGPPGTTSQGGKKVGKKKAELDKHLSIYETMSLRVYFKTHLVVWIP